jgi:hypothetical protein
MAGDAAAYKLTRQRLLALPLQGKEQSSKLKQSAPRWRKVCFTSCPGPEIDRQRAPASSGAETWSPHGYRHSFLESAPTGSAERLPGFPVRYRLLELADSVKWFKRLVGTLCCVGASLGARREHTDERPTVLDRHDWP